MTNIYIAISILANLLSIILALIGLYFIYENWRIWKIVGIESIKARVFLNKEFLLKIWFYLIIVGGLVMLRRVYRFLELTNWTNGHPYIEILFDVVGCIVIFILVLIAYQWYKLVHAHPAK
jgi:hypothetical protein